MDESSFIVEILLKAVDQASGPIRGLNRAVDDLKATAASDRATGDLQRGLDDVGDSARGAEGDLRSHREELDRNREAQRRHSEETQRSSDALGEHADSADAAREKIKAVGDETDNLTKAQERAAKAADKLSASHEDLQRDFENGRKSTDDYVNGLNRVAAGYEKLSRSLPIGNELGESLHRSALEAKAWGDSYEKSVIQVTRASRQSKTDIDKQRASAAELSAAVGKLSEEYRGFAVASRSMSSDEQRRGFQQISQEAGALARQLERGSDAWREMARVSDEAKRSMRGAQIDSDAQRLSRAYRDFDRLARSGQITASAARDSYRDFATGFDHLRDSIEKGSDAWRQYGRVIDDATKKARNARATVSGGGLIQGFFGNLSSAVSGGGLSDVDRALQNLSAHADNFGIKIVSLSANLRGLALTAGIGLFQQLDSVIVGTVGSLFSLGSAAAQAAASVGGSFVAALGQAIPGVALFAGALNRLKLVMQAVQAASNLAQQTATNQTQQQIQQLSSTNAVISAQQQLANSYKNVIQAERSLEQSQMSLTIARRDAQRQIVDLMLAEEQAALQAKGANITLAQAQQNLQKVILSGGTGTALASAQLQVQEAQLGRQQADVALPRAQQDYARARRQGVSGSPSVIAATNAVTQGRQALEQARQQVGGASRALQIAEIQARQSASAIQTAANQLAHFLSLLSPTERQLYNVMERLRKYFADPNSPFNKIADNLVAPFIKGFSRLLDLLNNQDFLKPLDKLSQALGGGISKIIDALTGRGGAKFIDDMAKALTQNVPIIADSIVQLIKIFEQIAKAASPALHIFIQVFNGLVTSLAQKFSTPKGLKDLTDFFNTGAQYAQDFVKWGGALLGLLAALGRQAAPVGDNAIKGWTTSLNNLTTWVNSHGKEVRQFFQQAMEAFQTFIGVIGQVGLAMIRLLDADSLKNFGNLLSQVIVPVLSDAIRVLGFFTNALISLLNFVPGLHTIIDVFGGFAVAAVAVGKLYSPIRRLVGAMNDLRKGNFGKLFGGGSGDIRIDSSGMQTAADTMDEAAVKMGTAADQMTGAATEQGAASDKQVTASTEQTAAADKEVVAATEQTTAAEEQIVGGGASGAGLLGGGALAASSAVLGPLALAVGGGLVYNQLDPYPKGAQQQGGLAGLLGKLGGSHRAGLGDELNNITSLDVSNTLHGTTPNRENPQLAQLAKSLKGINDPAELSTTKLRTLGREIIKLQRVPDLTAPQREGLRELQRMLDPTNVALERAGKVWGATFDGINTTTGNVMQQVKQVLKTDIKNISDNLGTGTQQGAQALAQTIFAAWQTVLKNTNESVNGIHRGLSYINGQLNKALGALGQAPLSLTQQASLAPNVLAGLLGGGLHGGTLLTSGGVASPHATGGYERPRSGGKIIQVAEGGYPEVVLTTDPKHADRQRGLLHQYLQEAPHVAGGLIPGFAAGGNVWNVRASAEESSSGVGWTELSTNGNAAAVSGHPRTATHEGGWDFSTLGRMYPRGTKLVITSGRRSGTFPLTDYGDGSSFAPAIGLTPAVQKALGGMPATVNISLADGGNIALASGFGKLVSGSGGGSGGAAVGTINAPKVHAAGALGRIAQASLDRITGAANKYLAGVTAAAQAQQATATGGGAAPAHLAADKNLPSGVSDPNASWNPLHKAVDRWIQPILNWASQHGWHGSITSGYRPGSVTTSGHTSNHSLTSYPGGAIDVGGPGAVEEGQALWNVVKNYPGHPSLLWGNYYIRPYTDSSGHTWPSDAGHFSATGHATGGWIEAAAKGAFIKAAKGFSGVVRKPTTFLAGESGDELVNVQPMQAGGHVAPTPRASVPEPQSSTGHPFILNLPSFGRVNWNSISAINIVVKQVGDVFAQLSDLGIKSSEFAKNFSPFVDQLLTQDTGVFDRLSAGFTVVQNMLNAALVVGGRVAGIGMPSAQRGYLRGIRSPYRTTADGTVQQVLSPDQQDTQQISALHQQRTYLVGERGVVNTVLTAVHNRLRQVTELAKKNPDKYKKALQSLTTEYNNLIGRVQTLTGQIAQNVTDVFSAEQTRVQDLLTRVSDTYQTQQSQIQTKQSIAQASGNYGKLPSFDRALAASALKEIAALQPVLKEAEKTGDKSLIDQVKQQISQLQETVTQAALQALSDAQQAIDQASQTTTSGIQSKQTIAQAMGNLSALPALDQAMAQAAQQQITQLQSVLYDAVAQGDPGLAAQIQQEIDQLQGTVAQATAQMIQDQISVIQQTAQTQQAQVSEYQSISQTMQGAASTPAQFAAAGALNQQALQLNQGSLTGQISSYQSLLAEAQSTGNTGAVVTITQTLDQLNAELVANTQALNDNTANVVNQTAQYVQARGQFGSGIFSGLAQIIQTVGQTTGATNVGALAGVTGASNQMLQGTNAALLSQLSQLGGGASGIASMLSGITDPMQFATLLGSANVTGAESGQDSAWIQAFEGIVSSLETNTQAIAQNNQQLAQLNGQLLQPQTWASATWQSFRMAVFSGMGNLMPQYQGLLSGSAIPSVAPSFLPIGANGNSVVPTIGTLNLTHPVEQLDPQVLGQQLFHELSTAP